jgi:hypothetical protein
MMSMAERQRSPFRTFPPSGRAGVFFIAAIAAALLLAGAWLAIRGSPGQLLQALVNTGDERGLQPVLFQGAPLRTAQGGVDRAYLLGTQSQTVYLPARRGGTRLRTDYLHVDLWAVDATSATVAWRQRLRSFKDDERAGRMLTAFRILGADGTTLWLNMEGPLGVSLADGRPVAGGADIARRNPQLTGKIINAPGYIAFGRNGLQLTLDDASQWRIDAADLSAAGRDTPVSRRDGIVAPANAQPSSTSHFQMRALEMGDRWLGVLTDAEADRLGKPPVVPGREADERPGAMQRFLEANHVPAPLDEPLPQPYRLWGARVKQVSAAPPDWPAELPDNWGMRPEFSDYKVLPEAPAFLRAGLLRTRGDAEFPLWYRNPDSVLVLHVDRLGDAGRLQLARVSGPLGKPVWNAALPLVALASVMKGEGDLLLWGSEANARNSGAGIKGVRHKLVRVDVATGATLVLDLSAEGMAREPGFVAPGS